MVLDNRTSEKALRRFRKQLLAQSIRGRLHNCRRTVSTRPPDVDCAVSFDLTGQDPAISRMMASRMLQVVRHHAADHLRFRQN